MSQKNPVTTPGIDPGTVRLVAQRINHYATPGPWREMGWTEIMKLVVSFHNTANVPENTNNKFTKLCQTSSFISFELYTAFIPPNLKFKKLHYRQIKSMARRMDGEQGKLYDFSDTVYHLTFRNLASYIQDGRKIALQMPHFIFIQQISILNILNMLCNLHFFLFKMPFIS